MSRFLEIESINFTIVEAAEHLRVSRSYPYKMINSGALKPSKLGSRVIIASLCALSRKQRWRERQLI